MPDYVVRSQLAIPSHISKLPCPAPFNAESLTLAKTDHFCQNKFWNQFNCKTAAQEEGAYNMARITHCY